MENTIYCNGFLGLSETETIELNGGISLQDYELIVLSVTTVSGILVSAACPAVGAGILLTGFAMCMEAEEYGRSKK